MAPSMTKMRSEASLETRDSMKFKIACHVVDKRPNGNLIIEGWMHPEPKPGKGKKRASRPYIVGVLPPIPFVVHSP